MCIFKRKQEKKAMSQRLVTPKEMSNRQHLNREGPAHGHMFDNSVDNPQRRRVNQVHLRLKQCKTTDTSLEEQKRQMELAHKAMGLCPNTTLIEKIAERQKKIDQTQEMSVARSIVPGKGDIVFSFTKRKKDDDTMAPDMLKPDSKKTSDSGEKKATDSGCNTPNPEEELIEEDPVDDEPNSENYMYNAKEIIYTCHDMIRSMGKAEIGDLAGDLDQAEVTGNIQWDPMAPVDVMQTRDAFNCQILRRNTLISNSLAMPTEAEKNKADLKTTTTAGDIPGKRKVTFGQIGVDLSEFHPNLDRTVNLSQTQSISAKRPPSARPLTESTRTKVMEKTATPKRVASKTRDK